MIDSISFIRAHMGRMSDTQIMRNLGLRRFSDYRELRAQAMVDRPRVPVEQPPRARDRILRRQPDPRPDPLVVLNLMAEATGIDIERLIAPKDAQQMAARDVLVWLLRAQCRHAMAAIGRALHMSEYATRLCFERYDQVLASGQEAALHGQWRRALAQRLRRP